MVNVKWDVDRILLLWGWHKVESNVDGVISSYVSLHYVYGFEYFIFKPVLYLNESLYNLTLYLHYYYYYNYCYYYSTSTTTITAQFWSKRHLSTAVFCQETVDTTAQASGKLLRVRCVTSLAFANLVFLLRIVSIPFSMWDVPSSNVFLTQDRLRPIAVLLVVVSQQYYWW